MRNETDQNNLNAMRLLAALSVLLSHSFPLAYGNDSFEPMYRYSKGQTTFGHIAVLVFFSISGYLITRSFERSRSKSRFLIARGLRLIPALAVVLFVLAFLAGPAFSSHSLVEYFTDHALYRYIVVNISLVLPFDDHLPGVFLHNAFPQAVNGSLWTLQYEALCYAAVFMLGIAGALRWPAALLILAVAVIMQRARRLGVVPELAIPFATGALVYLTPIQRNWLGAMVSLIIAALSLRIGGFSVIGGIFGSYAVLTFGLRKSQWLPDPMSIVGDLSYGVYIWAFPIQQIFVLILTPEHMRWWSLTACSLPVALIAAWISWHLVEEPAMRLKPKRSEKVDIKKCQSVSDPESAPRSGMARPSSGKL